MMDAAAARATSERRAAELLAAHALVKSSKLTATAAEERAEAARRAEVEAAAAFLAPRNAAEKEATELAVVADAARHALSELQGDEKRARVAIVSAKQTRQQHVHREDQRATHVEGLDCLQQGRLRHLGRMVPSCRHRRDGPLLLQVDPRRGRGRLRDAVDPQLDGAARRRRAADRPHLDGQPRALHRLGEADRAGARAAAAATVEKVVPCGRPCGRPGWAKGNARGARVKGWGGRGCAGAGRSAIAAAGCRIRGACGSGYGRTRAVLVRPFH
mmetsp:Transcript_40706/g.97602  ORF Transcript_40706/g.97602 Transcript_40706/m.97602 type:complete len:273 (+) Transcript_40706:362-1180(+)